MVSPLSTMVLGVLMCACESVRALSGPARPLSGRAGRVALKASAESWETSGTSRRGALGGLAAVGAATLATRPAVGAEATIFEPAKGSLAGRTIVITGGNTGLGLESAARLAAAGADVVATGRTAAKARFAEEEVLRRTGKAIRGVELDLGDLGSVKSFPTRLKGANVKKIDVLMENAGVMAIPEKLTTSNGFERQIGVNHLGHFALTSALMPLLEAAGAFRVVVVSSSATAGASRHTRRRSFRGLGPRASERVLPFLPRRGRARSHER